MRPLITLSLLLLLSPFSHAAEFAYITNQIKAGLHEDKSLDSPIIKVLPTGERLEVVKREEELSFVRDASGVSGWINNGYLMATAANDADIKKLQQHTTELEKRISDFKDRNIQLEEQLKAAGKAPPKKRSAEYTALKESLQTTEKQYKAEKLKVGELQIQITELRNRLGQDSDADALYSQIKGLEEENKKLEIELLKTLEKYQAGDVDVESISALSGSGFQPGMRNMIIYLLITLILGLFAGAYLLDMWNRRRHGGFRI